MNNRPGFNSILETFRNSTFDEGSKSKLATGEDRSCQSFGSAGDDVNADYRQVDVYEDIGSLYISPWTQQDIHTSRRNSARPVHSERWRRSLLQRR